MARDLAVPITGKYLVSLCHINILIGILRISFTFCIGLFIHDHGIGLATARAPLEQFEKEECISLEAREA
jgi:hypothetical protein